ncbi:1-acyl-sn-glycerol-3-phosphate acyltransferase [Brevibacterium luteolum]|uniref:1-acyl-sn-glycerol-3-phosphate acyltransferase n=1 Tax=Brevibacterium luteolum TaxID=199591 RepID=A0A849W864_9MICO|nr:1-acyl-sn-glycerol-3-phosphate acyltransferase [Brevibacterium luteolum]NNG79082.1 1-acyl-sn-glycerol-3-phosphate acyltransferase [Brevibacterium luteolum]NUL60837.1 1-acyl-sn-glycerol-3-phosphate acyltransferase [Brevibacterium luteolum]
MFYWLLKRIIVGPFLRALFRPWVRGLENIPESGGAIIAGNHLSFMDSIFVPLVAPRPVVYLAKKDYFTGRGVKGTATRWFFRLTNQLPMDRSGGSASEASLHSGLKVLNGGNLLGIYPEGTRSPDGNLYRGRTGVARLVLEAGVPVVPVALIGTDKVQPVGRMLPRLRRIGVVFGEPLDFSEYEGMAGDRFLLRSITDDIMYEILRLSGQRYIDTYASSAKTKLLAAKKADEQPSGDATA